MNGLIFEAPEGLKTFLKRYLKKEIENFVDITNIHKDHYWGETGLFIEVCMNENYKSHECDQFKLMEVLQKLITLYGEDSKGLSVKVIQLN